MATLINCRMIVYEVEMSKPFIFISDHTRLTFWGNAHRQYSVFFVICCKIVQWHFLIRHFSVKTFSNVSFPKLLSLGFYKKHNYMASKLNLSISKIAFVKLAPEGLGEMAQWLRVLSALPGDPSSGSSTHISWTTSVTSVLEDVMSLLASVGTRTHVVHIHTQNKCINKSLKAIAPEG